VSQPLTRQETHPRSRQQYLQQHRHPLIPLRRQYRRVIGNSDIIVTDQLAWTASTDNVGVTGYRVYRDALLIASVTTTTYSDAGLRPSTTTATVLQPLTEPAMHRRSLRSVCNNTGRTLPETPLKLNSPNGGEVLPTGTIYNIAWDGPSSAVTFDLSYSTMAAQPGNRLYLERPGKTIHGRFGNERGTKKTAL